VRKQGAEAQLAAKDHMLVRCQKTIEELQMKLATYEVYNSHGHTRTHTDAHAQRERAEEGGRSERGALIEREIARARKNGIRIHVDVYKYTHTHTHTHTHTCMGITQTQDELKKFAGIRRDIEDGILSPEKLDAAKKEVGGCAVEKCAVVK
jgi:hypothetical protein